LFSIGQVIYATSAGDQGPDAGTAPNALNFRSASRALVSGPLGSGTTTLTANVNAFGQLDTDGALSKDGLTFVFTRSAGPDLQLMFSTRSAVDQPFVAPQPVTFQTDGGKLPGQYPKGVFIAATGALYFAMVPSAATYSIYRAAPVATGTYAAPVLQTSDPILAESVVVTADEMTMYASVPNGADTNRDLAILTRSNLADNGWSAPQFLAPTVSSTVQDRPRWLSPDRCRLYVASERKNPGQYDLFVVTK
jgi:hypothetical protein